MTEYLTQYTHECPRCCEGCNCEFPEECSHACADSDICGEPSSDIVELAEQYRLEDIEAAREGLMTEMSGYPLAGESRY